MQGNVIYALFFVTLYICSVFCCHVDRLLSEAHAVLSSDTHARNLSLSHTHSRPLPPSLLSLQAEEEVSRIEKELGTFKGKSNLKGQTLFGL